MNALRHNYLCNTSLLVKWHVLKDVRRTAEPIGPLNSSLCFAREVDILWNLQYRKSAIGVKLLRPVFPVQCHTGDSMPHIDENDKKIEIEELTVQKKKQEIQKDNTWDASPSSATKPLLKKSSRFIPASFFSFQVDETEFTPASVFNGLIDSAREKLPKLILGLLLLGAGFAYFTIRADKGFLQPSEVITTSLDEVSSNAKPVIRQLQKFPKKLMELVQLLPHEEINEEEASLFDMLWLLLASVIFVPIFQKIPGGSPVLGYLAAGILIGPYGLSIIRHVHGTKAIAEFGVVFLLFNIGLELSVERLSSMKKYVFGLGTAQILMTAVVIGLVAQFLSGHLGPAAIVIGNGLALSSTAVVLQVPFVNTSAMV